MNIAAIKKLLDKDLNTLRKLENELLEGEPLSEEVIGVDEGEQLTHITGAIWALEQAQANGTEPHKEVRNFIARVRESIN
ncbi:MAG: hypothetical protein KDC92_13455 [Bacteroidetes bacterium]|nr:hypothetical protein [Bacteroidota bacterium]